MAKKIRLWTVVCIRLVLSESPVALSKLLSLLCITQVSGALKSTASFIFFIRCDADVPACHLNRPLVWSYTTIFQCPQIIRRRLVSGRTTGVTSPCLSFSTH